MIGEVNAWTSNVMNLIWLIGTFTFAVVLAVVTEDIVATVLVSLCLPLCCVYLFAVSTSLLCLPLCCVYLFAVSTSLLCHLSDFKPWGRIHSTVSTCLMCQLSEFKPLMHSPHLVVRSCDVSIRHCATSLTLSLLLHLQRLVARTLCCITFGHITFGHITFGHITFGHISWSIRSHQSSFASSFLMHKAQKPWLALWATVCEHTEWHSVSHLAALASARHCLGHIWSHQSSSATNSHTQDSTALSVSAQNGIWSVTWQAHVVMTPNMVHAGHQERKLPGGGHQPHPHSQLEQPDCALVAPDCHQQEGASRTCICWVCTSHTHCDCCTPTHQAYEFS